MKLAYAFSDEERELLLPSSEEGALSTSPHPGPVGSSPSPLVYVCLLALGFAGGLATALGFAGGLAAAGASGWRETRNPPAMSKTTMPTPSNFHAFRDSFLTSAPSRHRGIFSFCCPDFKPSCERRVLLFGAHGRHNFGDILLGQITLTLLLQTGEWEKKELVFVDIGSGNMTEYGGFAVKNVNEILSAEYQKQRCRGPRTDVIHTGGDTMGAQFSSARQNFLLPPPLPEHKYWEGYCPWKCGCEGAKNGTQAYVLAPFMVANPGAFVFNSVGGSLSKKSRDNWNQGSFQSSRNPITHFVLLPDAAILTAEIFDETEVKPRREAQRAESGESEAELWAVQFHTLPDGPWFTENTVKPLNWGSQLCQAASKRPGKVNVTFFRAGAAPGHDDIEALRKERDIFMSECPDLHASVFADLNVWSIVALISRADLVVSTSLHVRILAFVYARPRVTGKTLKTKPDKHSFFATFWDDPLASDAELEKRRENAMRGDPSVTPPASFPLATNLVPSIEVALDPPGGAHFRDKERPRGLARRYREKGFDVWRGVLTPRCAQENVNA